MNFISYIETYIGNEGVICKNKIIKGFELKENRGNAQGEGRLSITNNLGKGSRKKKKNGRAIRPYLPPSLELNGRRNFLLFFQI